MGAILHLQSPPLPPRRRRQGLRPTIGLSGSVPPRQEAAPQNGAPQMAVPPPGPDPNRSRHPPLPRLRQGARRPGPLQLRGRLGGDFDGQQRIRRNAGPRRLLRHRASERRGGRVSGPRVFAKRPRFRDEGIDALDPEGYDNAGESDPTFRAGQADGSSAERTGPDRYRGQASDPVLRPADAHG
ncbi:unnamed protein product [Linum tenue]|uniref:Uncharacterized protein n=1 Tax=Linum tenue TaxID=586396 RepID=A0AAV0J7E2_9ROSI|nr:unnamed protein product [Linum tenue]